MLDRLAIGILSLATVSVLPVAAADRIPSAAAPAAIIHSTSPVIKTHLRLYPTGESMTSGTVTFTYDTHKQQMTVALLVSHLSNGVHTATIRRGSCGNDGRVMYRLSNLIGPGTRYSLTSFRGELSGMMHLEVRSWAWKSRAYIVVTCGQFVWP